MLENRGKKVDDGIFCEVLWVDKWGILFNFAVEMGYRECSGWLADACRLGRPIWGCTSHAQHNKQGLCRAIGGEVELRANYNK